MSADCKKAKGTSPRSAIRRPSRECADSKARFGGYIVAYGEPYEMPKTVYNWACKCVDFAVAVCSVIENSRTFVYASL